MGGCQASRGHGYQRALGRVTGVRTLRAGEELSDVVVVAGENRNAHVAFASDDDAQVAINPGFVVGLPELLVEKPRGKTLRRGEIEAASVVRL